MTFQRLLRWLSVCLPLLSVNVFPSSWDCLPQGLSKDFFVELESPSLPLLSYSSPSGTDSVNVFPVSAPRRSWAARGRSARTSAAAHGPRPPWRTFLPCRCREGRAGRIKKSANGTSKRNILNSEDFEMVFFRFVSLLKKKTDVTLNSNWQNQFQLKTKTNSERVFPLKFLCFQGLCGCVSKNWSNQSKPPSSGNDTGNNTCETCSLTEERWKKMKSKRCWGTHHVTLSSGWKLDWHRFKCNEQMFSPEQLS